jgi:type II secretory pathway component PulF
MPEEKKEISREKKNIRFPKIGLREEKKYFIENLGMLLGANINPEMALGIIESETKSPRMKRVLHFLLGEIEKGSSLWLALQKSGILAERYITLLRIGEQSGKIVENLSILSAQEQKENDFRSKIRSATLYPAFVLCLTVILGLGISWFILPRLASVFSQMNIPLPLFTRILIKIGTFISHWGKIAIPAFFAFLFFGFFFFFVFKKTKFLGQALLFRLPGIKRVIMETELARFGYLLGTLLGTGVPLVESLKSLAEATNFYAYKKLYLYLSQGTQDGMPFAQSFASYPKTGKLIPPSVQYLVMAAEQSGKLPEVFLSIGRKFEAKAEVTTKNLTTLLEPILIIAIWLGVVFIALAIIMPIYNLIGGMNH